METTRGKRLACVLVALLVLAMDDFGRLSGPSTLMVTAKVSIDPSSWWLAASSAVV
jgi:hypothetical protein